MDANVKLKGIFNTFEFVLFNEKTNEFKTKWYPLYSSKTNRLLSIEEVQINTPQHCKVEFRDNNFRFIRKYEKL